MDWSNLFTMQQKLDEYIQKKQSLEGEDLFEQKVLALIVELSELANETRSFKFWSTNQNIDKKKILEEYVDGIHFLLSLGLEKGFTYRGEKKDTLENSINHQFILLYELIIHFKHSPTEESYKRLFSHYLHLGKFLHITEDALVKAYIEKNEVNFKRQDEGY